MKVIAKTQSGLLIEATENEVTQILNAALGNDKKREVGIGTKIPAVDYSATITKLKGLKDGYDMNTSIAYAKKVLNNLEELNNQLELKED